MSDPFERAAAQELAAREHTSPRNSAHRGVRLAFNIHLSVFVTVQLMLVAVWFMYRDSENGTSTPWFIYPLLGWGIGLVAHYVVTRDIVRGGRRT